ncbi:MAG: hypothetical protein U0M21_06370 [Emergencia sp.]|nr:hypothetical protein [Emergencia sp.]
MNAHFSVINKRGALVTGLSMFLCIVLFSISVAGLFGGGTKLWLVGFILSAIVFLICLVIMISVLTAGIDIKNGIVIMPDLDPSKGKQPKFRIEELQAVDLKDGEGNILNPRTDSLLGARIVFALKDGREEIYYPMAITANQFEKIKDGMQNLAQL